MARHVLSSMVCSQYSAGTVLPPTAEIKYTHVLFLLTIKCHLVVYWYFQPEIYKTYNEHKLYSLIKIIAVSYGLLKPLLLSTLLFTVILYETQMHTHKHTHKLTKCSYLTTQLVPSLIKDGYQFFKLLSLMFC